MHSPFTKNDAQYGVRAAAAFVLANTMEAANAVCTRRSLDEVARHERIMTSIYSDLKFAVDSALATYHRTLEVTQGDDEDDDGYVDNDDD